MIQVLRLSGRLPGMNEIITGAGTDGAYGRAARGRTRASKGYAASKRRLCSDIATLARTQLSPVKTAQLSFLWVEEDKRRDPDNIAAGSKIILDALVTAGIISGDGWKHIKPPLVHDWQVGDSGVVVTIKGEPWNAFVSSK